MNIKYIVTHQCQDSRFGNAFSISGDYSHSIDAFQKLAAEARKSFPALRDEDIECETVQDSTWCKGCSMIRFSVPPDTKSDGWHNVEGRLPL